MAQYHTAEVLGQYEIGDNFVYMVGLVQDDDEGSFFVVQRKEGDLDTVGSLEDGWEILEQNDPVTLQVISLCLYQLYGELARLHALD